MKEKLESAGEIVVPQNEAWMALTNSLAGTGCCMYVPTAPLNLTCAKRFAHSYKSISVV